MAKKKTTDNFPEPDKFEQDPATLVDAIEVPTPNPEPGLEPTRYQTVQDEMRSVGVEPIRAETREVERQLTHDELEKIKDQIVDHHNEADRLEEEKKAANAKLGGEQKGHEAASAILRQKLKEGKDISDRLVMIGIDPKLKVRRVFDVETGVEICREDLSAKDLQTDMGLGEKVKVPTKEPETPLAPNEVKPGVIGLGYEAPRANKHGVDIGDTHVHSSVVNEILDQLDEEKPDAQSHEYLADATIQIEMLYREDRGGEPALVITENSGLTLFCQDEALFDEINRLAEKGSYLKVKIKSDIAGTSREIISLEESAYTPDGADEPDIQLPKGFEEGSID